MRNHSDEIEQKIVNLTEQMASDQLAKWQPSNQLPSSNFKGICRTFTKVLESVSDIWGPEVLSKFMVKVSILDTLCSRNFQNVKLRLDFVEM